MSNTAAHLKWASAVECYTEPHWYFVFCWCLMWITVVIDVGIVVVSVREMKKESKQATEAETNFKRAYLFILVLFIISCLGFPVAIAVSVACVFPGEFLKYQAIALVGLCFNFFGLSFLYLFTLYRLKIVFANTPFELNRIIFVVFWLAFLVQIVSTIMSAYYFMAEPWPWPKGLRWYTIYLYINIAGGGSIVFLFFHKIVKFTRLSQNATAIANANGNANAKTEGGNGKKNNQLLLLGIRYLILGLIALISTSIGDLVGVYRVEVEDNMFMFITNITYMCIDTVINAICLALQFRFGQAQYYKYCRCCDRSCRVCVAKILDIDLSDKNNQFVLQTNSKMTAEFSFTTNRPAVVQQNLAEMVEQDEKERAEQTRDETNSNEQQKTQVDVSTRDASLGASGDREMTSDVKSIEVTTAPRTDDPVTMMRVGNTDQMAVLH
eukprot:CAMPEP_0202701598 /NCGR_PEP_ID=MMETSP1385-20130828/14669_1 /ASSEMBLY_ACC=CAM_ASM_000861 /TAXON_ID=933848 /ORGANISM="Elphidium margaritaceum" /LENGTH=437 /DNA_ID=CAMNT_0049359049 /DNA_START=125 /DNA_END=1438 /DNA_ORIENTATION=+